MLSHTYSVRQLPVSLKVLIGICGWWKPHYYAPFCIYGPAVSLAIGCELFTLWVSIPLSCKAVLVLKGVSLFIHCTKLCGILLWVTIYGVTGCVR